MRPLAFARALTAAASECCLSLLEIGLFFAPKLTNLYHRPSICQLENSRSSRVQGYLAHKKPPPPLRPPLGRSPGQIQWLPDPSDPHCVRPLAFARALTAAAGVHQTVNLRRPERARNEGTTGPTRLDDTRCTTYKRRINYRTEALTSRLYWPSLARCTTSHLWGVLTWRERVLS